MCQMPPPYIPVDLHTDHVMSHDHPHSQSFPVLGISQWQDSQEWSIHSLHWEGAHWEHIGNPLGMNWVISPGIWWGLSGRSELGISPRNPRNARTPLGFRAEQGGERKDLPTVSSYFLKRQCQSALISFFGNVPLDPKVHINYQFPFLEI